MNSKKPSLPTPTADMTADAKAALLPRYVRAGQPLYRCTGARVEPLDFKGAHLSGLTLVRRSGAVRGSRSRFLWWFTQHGADDAEPGTHPWRQAPGSALFCALLDALCVIMYLDAENDRMRTGALIWCAIGLVVTGACIVGLIFQVTSLARADLRRADLSGAVLTGVSLTRANLRGAVLTGVDLSACNVTEAQVDTETVQNSGWSREEVLDLWRRGAEFDDLQTILDMLAGGLGLVLALRTGISRVDRLLVDGMILGVLGPQSDCRLAEYREQGDTAIMRLEGSCREDLEAVAEALYHRVWKLQERAQYQAFAKLAGTLGASLSGLVDRLERMELRLPSEEAAADQSAAATARRELTLLRTWDPDTHPRTTLDRLLAMLEPDELHLLLARGPEGAEVVAWVPAGAVAPTVIAGPAVDELLRRGLVDEALFARVAEARPGLAEAADRVAALWAAGPG